MDRIFATLFLVPEGESITLTYSDDSQKTFDSFEWDVYKIGIKKNLYDKGLIKNIELSWKKSI